MQPVVHNYYYGGPQEEYEEEPCPYETPQYRLNLVLTAVAILLFGLLVGYTIGERQGYSRCADQANPFLRAQGIEIR
jgi:hypothetical protein